MSNKAKINDATEWMDLKAVRRYASVSARTLREWIHLTTNPLPASQVRNKIYVRRADFDRWMEGHRLGSLDIRGMVDEIVAAVRPN